MSKASGMQRREKRALVRLWGQRLRETPGRPHGVSARTVASLRDMGLSARVTPHDMKPCYVLVLTDAGKAMARALRSTGDGVRGLR